MTDETKTTEVTKKRVPKRAAKGSAVKKASKKSSPKKATPKKPSKKATPKKASKKVPTAKKESTRKIDGLNKPQTRILEFLSKQNKAQTRKDISEGASVDLAMLNSYIGSHKEDIRLKNDAKVCVSLLTMGFVKATSPEDESVRGVAYEITSAGKKAIS